MCEVRRARVCFVAKATRPEPVHPRKLRSARVRSKLAEPDPAAWQERKVRPPCSGTREARPGRSRARMLKGLLRRERLLFTG